MTKSECVNGRYASDEVFEIQRLLTDCVLMLMEIRKNWFDVPIGTIERIDALLEDCPAWSKPK